MSIPLILIFLLLLLFLIKNYKKTVIAYAPFKLFFHERVMLFSTAGGSYMSFDGVFCSAIFFLFLLYYKHPLKKIYRYPLMGAMSLYAINLVVYGLNPEPHLISLTIEPTVRDLVFFAILFYLIKTPEDISSMIKSLMIYVALLIGNGLAHIVTGTNYIGDFFVNASNYHFISGNSVARFGLQRTPSFMPHSICMGSICVMILYLFAYLWITKSPYLIDKKKYLSFIVPLLLVGIIISNSRTPLFGLLIGMAFLVNRKMFKGNRGLFILLAIGAFLFVCWDYLEYMYNITFYENMHDAEGSTTDLRMVQFGIAYSVFMEHIWIGGGNDTQLLALFDERDVGGMESIWFPLMYRMGLLGIISYIVVLITPLFKFSKSHNFRYILGFFCVWLTLNTLSSQPGLTIGIYFLFMIFFYKSDNILYNDSLWEKQYS